MKSATLKKYQTNKPMMDTKGRVAPPKVAEDANGRTRFGGQSQPVPDRDGPSKRSSSSEPPAKKANGASKAARMGEPKGKAPIKKAPATSMPMVQGSIPTPPSSPMGPMQMPPKNMIQSMKKSLGSSKRYAR